MSILSTIITFPNLSSYNQHKLHFAILSVTSHFTSFYLYHLFVTFAINAETDVESDSLTIHFYTAHLQFPHFHLHLGSSMYRTLLNRDEKVMTVISSADKPSNPDCTHWVYFVNPLSQSYAEDRCSTGAILLPASWASKEMRLKEEDQALHWSNLFFTQAIFDSAMNRTVDCDMIHLLPHRSMCPAGSVTYNWACGCETVPLTYKLSPLFRKLINAINEDILYCMGYNNPRKGYCLMDCYSAPDNRALLIDRTQYHLWQRTRSRERSQMLPYSELHKAGMFFMDARPSVNYVPAVPRAPPRPSIYKRRSRNPGGPRLYFTQSKGMRNGRPRSTSRN